MKKTLLIPLLLAGFGVSAQTVNTFYTVSANTYQYKVATNAGVLDESAAGENVSWNFSGLTEAGGTSTTTTAASESIATDFPTTNTVVETTSNDYTSQFFLNNTAGGGSFLTAYTTNGILLNYSTNNADLGTFPKTYGSAATTDAVSGSYSYETYSGTFSGTCTTSVDGYGTLTVNVGTTPAGTPVTRLKIVQNLNLIYSGLPVGTVVQTLYSYYAASPADAPVFRTLTLDMDIPVLGIDDVDQSIESFYNPAAASQQFAANKMVVAPNPVANVLHFTGDAQLANVTVTDAAGRTVLTAAGNDVNVSALGAGIYYVAAQTESGLLTQKIVKQ